MAGHERRRPLKIGLQLPEIEYVARWRELSQMARRAEELGFDSLWVGDHLLYRNPGDVAKGPWEAWSLMSALAAVTDRVEIGPLVASTSFHNPALIAKKAAPIEEISDGRLILGLGAGWNQTEYSAYGYPYDNRVSRFEEAFTIIRTLLATGSCDFHGEYYDLTDCELLPVGPRAGGPPLMLGSEGPRMMSIALPHVQYWNAWYAWFRNDPANLPPLLEKIDAACRDVGRDPSTLIKTCAALVAMTGAQGRLAGDPTDRGARALSGTPEELAAVIRQYADAGIGHLQVILDPNTLAAIEEFAPVLEILDRG